MTSFPRLPLRGESGTVAEIGWLGAWLWRHILRTISVGQTIREEVFLIVRAQRCKDLAKVTCHRRPHRKELEGCGKRVHGRILSCPHRCVKLSIAAMDGQRMKESYEVRPSQSPWPRVMHGAGQPSLRSRPCPVKGQGEGNSNVER